ncbi:MAG: hypothetical protein JSV82_04790 [Planctomycetota bacterium]|nr:MAG: hypothetical protein JSV82_04790 [Planctomycetota bacterium]
MWDTIYRTYFKPAFLICAAVLAIAASGMSIAIKTFGVYLKKEPLPLKKPLDLLAEKGLGPYVVVSKNIIEEEEIIKSLGTRDYIQWILEDTKAQADSAVRKCALFITYYELPDAVPHVPEECYMGSGFQKLASDSVTFNCRSAIDNHQFSIPGRYLIFAGTGFNHWQSATKFPVLYFFSVNGDYSNSRENARIALNKNIFSKYSYFSKVEWKFFNTKFGASVYPGAEEAVEASQKLLGVILPVLEKEHWPILDGSKAPAD